MNLNRTRPVRRLFCAAVAALACSVAACSSPGGTTAGGAGGPVVLHMATVNSHLGYTPEIGYLANRVSQLSGGNLRLEVVPHVGDFMPGAERQVVRVPPEDDRAEKRVAEIVRHLRPEVPDERIGHDQGQRGVAAGREEL